MVIRKTRLFAALTLAATVGVFAPAQFVSASPTDQPVLQDKKPAKNNSVVGTVVSVDLAGNTFTVKTKADKEVQVQINDATKFMIGKETSTRDAVLVVDKHVRIKHKDGVALAVMQMPEKPEKPDKPKKPKKPAKPE